MTVCLIIYLLAQLFFLYMFTLYRSQLQISQMLKQEERGRLMEAEIVSYQNYLQVAKQMRHDLRHHNALILKYLEMGAIEEAKKYLHANTEELSSTALHEFSVNPVANAVLRIYERKAQALEIDFTVFADIPNALPLTLSETGVLFSNLMENAVEACEKADPSVRQIALTVHTDEKRLALELCNSCSGTVLMFNGMPRSTKPGGGMGTKSIRYTVEKYGGMLRFKQEKNHFITQIILPLSDTIPSIPKKKHVNEDKSLYSQ